MTFTGAMAEDPRLFAGFVNRVARNMAGSKYAGIWIVDLHKAAIDDGMRMNLDDFKDMLLKAHRKGFVRLERADLVPPKDHRRRDLSEIRHANASFHRLEAP